MIFFEKIEAEHFIFGPAQSTDRTSLYPKMLSIPSKVQPTMLITQINATFAVCNHAAVWPSPLIKTNAWLQDLSLLLPLFAIEIAIEIVIDKGAQL